MPSKSLWHSAVGSTPVFRQLGTAYRIVCNEWSVFAWIRLPTLHLPAGQTCGNICIVRCWQSRFPTLDSHSSSQALYHSFPCKHEKLVHSAAPPLPKKSYDFPGTPITQAAVLFVVVGAERSNQLFDPLLLPACQLTIIVWHRRFPPFTQCRK